MSKFAFLIAVAFTSPARAGGEPYPMAYPREAPAIVVYAPAPSPPVVIGNAVGGTVTGAIAMPFNILNAIFGQPQAQLVTDGAGGMVPPPTGTRNTSGGPCYGPEGRWHGDGNIECAR